MAHLTSTQLAWRRRIEGGLRLAAPFLDLLLAAGDRLSRVADRDELEAGSEVRPLRGRERTRLAPGHEA